jgi:hypothetical protein
MVAAEPEASAALKPKYTIVQDSEPKLPKYQKKKNPLKVILQFSRLSKCIPLNTITSPLAKRMNPSLSYAQFNTTFYVPSSTNRVRLPATLYTAVTPRLPAFDNTPWAKLCRLIPDTTVESFHTNHEGNLPSPHDL